ncbi:hypothetical protein RBWH47_01338 [Rhodopirellula baltica WH47]|uniref:Uncharacterized protein n=1 Tax=Rhodopirellula baltica WH47 TaxID=991778 RepID=F2AY25_RHOBT|nr:hypothetical protein RBWH47_01338 [Rhodopirellula baltica WH47]
MTIRSICPPLDAEKLREFDSFGDCCSLFHRRIASASDDRVNCTATTTAIGFKLMATFAPNAQLR